MLLANTETSTVFASNTAVYSSNKIAASSFWSNNGSTIFTLSNVGIGVNNVTENLCVYSNMSLSNSSGKVILSTSNNYLGIANPSPLTQLHVTGNLLATNYSKVIKSLDTSNAITFNVNWTNSYNANNSYYITVFTTQMINNQTAYGYKEQTNLFAVSNFSLIDVTSSRAFGNNGNSIFLAMTASNNKLITMTSSTNLVTTGAVSHVTSAELIAFPQSTNIGAVWLN